MDYQVGEMHITADGLEMYFHSARPGGEEGWTSKSRRMPLVSGNSSRTFSGQFREKREQTLHQLGRPGALVHPDLPRLTLAVPFSELLFVHHFYRDDVMLEADIFVAHKK